MKQKPAYRILCFKTSEASSKVIDKVAKRHNRTRANLLNLFSEKMIALEKKGELDEVLAAK